MQTGRLVGRLWQAGRLAGRKAALESRQDAGRVAGWQGMLAGRQAGRHLWSAVEKLRSAMNWLIVTRRCRAMYIHLCTFLKE